MKTLTVPADTSQLDRVTSFLDEALESVDCPMALQLRIELAVEEVFVNISSYAYPGRKGTVDIQCKATTQRIVLQFMDCGIPYNPLAKEDADTSREATLAREGGLGILLVKKTMDRVHYEYLNGKNVLTIEKELRD